MNTSDESRASRTHVVRGDDGDRRAWCVGQPVCPLLKQHHIAHVEILEARVPFRMIRREQSGTFMMACFGGSGAVLADGKWRKVTAGQACLLPPFATNGMRATGREPWRICGVRYHESRESLPIISRPTPVIGIYDPHPLRNAIQGLHAESAGDASPAVMHLWSELIQSYVLRFSQPHRTDARLWKMWETVNRRLDHAWTLDELAQHACLSKEHLRKLCHKELGRTPMQQVTFLRMRLACHLLSTTRNKIQSISRQVGYANPFTFSNTFHQWTGWRPSDIRKSANEKHI